MQQDYENTLGQEQDEALVLPEKNPVIKTTDEQFARLDGVEVPSLRNEHTKQFDLGENRYQAVIFPEPVHYLKDGQWEEIDNNLEETEVGDGRRVLRNRANAMQCELPAQADDGALVKLTREGHVLTWAFEKPPQSVQAEVKTGETLREEHLLKMARERSGFVKRTDEQLLAKLTPEDLRSDVTGKSAEVRYEDILPGVSVRYALRGDELKEDIICADREALEQVAIKLPVGYEYLVKDDQSVSVRDLKTGEERFFLRSPVVFDAKGMTVAAQTVLEPQDSYIRLRYEISKDFLTLCRYPVTIDPVVKSHNSETKAEAVRFNMNENKIGTIEKTMLVGTSGTNVYATAMRFGTLADLKASDTVVSAKLKIYAVPGKSPGRFVGVYRINNAWDPKTTTWGALNKSNGDIDGIDKYPLDYAYGGGDMTFDVTNQYREWYRANRGGGSENNGILLKCIQGTDSKEKCFTFYSPTHATASKRPLMTVDYISHAGMASWFEYESQSAGMAGTTHVDLFNGNVVHQHADTAMGGNRMPVSISHYYNSSQSKTGSHYNALSTDEETSYQALYRCGHGWKHSGLQWIYEKTIEKKNYYIWVDGTGTEHWFKNDKKVKEDKETSYTAKDLEGMELKLRRYAKTRKRVARIEIEDKSHSKMTFQKKMSEGDGLWKHYWLVQVEDSMADPKDEDSTTSVNVTTYDYKLPGNAADRKLSEQTQKWEGRLEKITDSVGRETVFHYEADTETAQLKRITTPDVNGETMQNMLREVRFTYDDGNRLVGIDYNKLDAPAMGFTHHTEFTYLYDADHVEQTNLLTSARNYDGTKVSTTYERIYVDQAVDISDNADGTGSTQTNTGTVNYELCRAVSLETTKGDAKGAMQRFAYKNSQTEVTVVEGDEPSPTDKKIIYQFNDKGNVISTRDELGYAQFTKYTSGHENTPSESSKMQKAVVNLLRNGDFSRIEGEPKVEDPVWMKTNTNVYHVKTNTGGNTLAVDGSSAGKCLSLQSLKMQRRSAAGEMSIVQKLDLAMGEVYTFSVYVKADGIQPSTGAQNADICGCVTEVGAHVHIRPVTTGTAPDVTGPQITENTGEDFDAGLPTDDWDRYIVVYDTTGYEGTVEIAVELFNSTEKGTVWFSAPQLEEGLVANSVNLLSNGDFSASALNDKYPATLPGGRQFPKDWTAGADIDIELKTKKGVTASTIAMAKQIGVKERDADKEDPMPAMLSGKYLQQCGLPRSKAMNTTFYQDIQASGKGKDVFFLGGWASGKAMPGSTNEKRGFYMKMSFYCKSSGTYSWRDGKGGKIPFNSEWVGWQAAGGAVAAPAEYTKVRVILAYKGQPNAAKFSNIYLFREEFGQSYSFDQNKNLVDTTTLAGQKAGMEYDSAHNLIAYKQPGASGKYKMDYGKYKKQHLVKTTTTPTGMVQKFEHDKFGNQTMAQTGKDKNTGFVRTKAEYDKDSTFTYMEDGAQKTMSLKGGNFAVKQTDPRGKVSTVDIHPATGLKRWVRDAKGTQVHYGYDKRNRMTSTECTPAGGTYRNKYTYDESGRLETVSHNTSMNEAEDVTYTFEYDELGAQTKVKVGEQWLSRNVYAEDRTHKLLSTEFANGGRIVNTYDDFDRIVGVHFDEEEQPRYTYAYGANGQAAYLNDTHLNRKHWTEYDLAMRPKRMTTLDNENGEILYRATLKHDKLDHLVSFGEQTAGKETHLTSFEYDKDDRVTEVAFDDNNRKDKKISHGVRYAYNGAGMVKTKTVYNDGKERKITYKQVAGKDNGGISPLTDSISQPGLELAYEYDKDLNNITGETRDGTSIRYGYDELGQLDRADDRSDETAGENGTTWLYTYDLGGNILKKVYHKYSTAATINPATNPGTETVYEYGNPNWKDQLTAYDGKAITYDAIGNPLSYDGWSYEWKAGRKLMGMRRQVQLEGEYLNPLDVSIMRGELIPGTEEEGPNGSTIASVKVRLYDGRVGTMTMELIQAYDPQYEPVCIPLEDGRYAILTKDGQIYIAPGEGEYVYPGAVNIVRAEVIPGTETEPDEYGNTIGTARVELEDGRTGTLQVSIHPRYEETDGMTPRAVLCIPLEDGRNANPLDDIFCERSGERTQEITYKYNAAGLRIQKAVDGVATDYYLHGKLVMHMTRGEEKLHFYYDAQSRVQTVKYNGEYYDYVHNLQGDIVGIVDKEGAFVVKYGYDAWGKLLAATEIMAETLGKLNPFRYRGYVYDEETGLYYLRSRYYSPEWGRFVNADSIIKGNIYCYCFNNPVNFFDYNGKSAAPVAYGGQANCYAYAFGLEIDPRTGAEFDHKPQPGEFANPDVKGKRDYWKGNPEKIKEGIIEAVQADGAVLGFTFTEVPDGNIATTEDSWVVGLGLSYHCADYDILGLFPHMYDYHWWRKDADNTWSHKLGGDGTIRSTDEAGKTITDPQSSDNGQYKYFLGYFLVTKTRATNTRATKTAVAVIVAALVIFRVLIGGKSK